MNKDTQGMTSLKVDNLTYRTSPEDLRKSFEKYGDVGDVYIPRDRFTRESRGFAFVRFYDRKDADDAMDALDGSTLDGRELRVQLAKYGRPSEPQRRGSSRGGGRGGGRSYGRDRRSPPRRRRRYSRSYSRSRSRSRSRGRYSPSKSRSPSPARRDRGPPRSRSKSPPSGSRSRSRTPQ